VSLFRRYAKGGDNADLKNWAGKTLAAQQPSSHDGAGSRQEVAGRIDREAQLGKAERGDDGTGDRSTDVGRRQLANAIANHTGPRNRAGCGRLDLGRRRTRSLRPGSRLVAVFTVRSGVPLSGKGLDDFPSSHAVHIGALASAASVLPSRQRNAVGDRCRPGFTRIVLLRIAQATAGLAVGALPNACCDGSPASPTRRLR
jgi:hypothetical protein